MRGKLCRIDDFEVVRVMSRRDLYRSSAELRVHEIIRDHGNYALEKRQDQVCGQ